MDVKLAIWCRRLRHASCPLSLELTLLRNIKGTPPIAIITTEGSGDGRSRARAAELCEALRESGHAVTLREFSDLDTLRSWAEAGGILCSLLVCIGGDGTLNAAVSAALRQSVPFLPVPSGFGNLFATALRQPRRVDQVVGLINTGARIAVDVGRYKREFFLCQQSFGLLQEIQDRTEAQGPRPRVRWLRSMAYYEAAVRQALRDTRVPRLTVAVDGQPVAHDAAVVTVSNVPTYGTWLKLTPSASPIDGLFDVFVMRGRSKAEILKRLLTHHLNLTSAVDGASVRRGRRITVAAPHAAAEEIVILPRRLTVIVSHQTARALFQTARGTATDREVA